MIGPKENPGLHILLYDLSRALELACAFVARAGMTVDGPLADEFALRCGRAKAAIELVEHLALGTWMRAKVEAERRRYFEQLLREHLAPEPRAPEDDLRRRQRIVFEYLQSCQRGQGLPDIPGWPLFKEHLERLLEGPPRADQPSNTSEGQPL